MIIIFLDIDGVLWIQNTENVENRLRELYEEQHKPVPHKFSGKETDKAAADLFAKNALANLKTLVDKIEKSGEEVGFVVHSNWRIDRSVDDLKEILSQHFFISKRIIGKIDDELSEYYSSEDFYSAPIQGWLNANKEKYQINKFVIIDDTRDFSKTFKENFIKCDSGKLLTEENINQALQKLGIFVTSPTHGVLTQSEATLSQAFKKLDLSNISSSLEVVDQTKQETKAVEPVVLTRDQVRIAASIGLLANGQSTSVVINIQVLFPKYWEFGSVEFGKLKNMLDTEFLSVDQLKRLASSNALTARCALTDNFRQIVEDDYISVEQALSMDPTVLQLLVRDDAVKAIRIQRESNIKPTLVDKAVEGIHPSDFNSLVAKIISNPLASAPRLS